MEAERQGVKVAKRQEGELAHRVLPGMAERGYGRIINVASLAGYAAGSAGQLSEP